MESELEKAKQTYRDLKSEGLASKENIKKAFVGGEQHQSFLEYVNQRKEEIFNEGGIRNYKKYNGLYNKLKDFTTSKRKSEDILFSELTPALLSQFEAYLHSLKNERQPEKKLKSSTIEVNLNIFKTIVKRAIEVENLMKPDKDPFRGYKYTKANKTTKEIEQIINLELPKNDLIWHCRNCFLFSFYCAGIRVGDLIQLRWRNIISKERIEYQMAKNSKPRDMILVPQARDILAYYWTESAKPNDYVFPLLDSKSDYAQAITKEDIDTLTPELKTRLFNQIGSKTTLLNKYLKKIALQAGIEKNLTMHIARHSR